MSVGEIGTIAALTGAALGAVVSYLISRRLHSGDVGTTDADRLWKQNDNLINAYMNDNGALRAEIAELRGLLRKAEDAERECMERYYELQQQVGVIEQKVGLKPSGEASL